MKIVHIFTIKMIRPLKLFIIATTILITGSLLISLNRVDKVESKATETKLPFSNISVKTEVKTILYWTPMFSRKDFYLGNGSAIFEKCVYTNCFATYDKNYLTIDEFDALIFHGVEYTEELFGKPSKRNPKQMYIFGCLESPIYSWNHMKATNNFYNWTMTYRLDSDIIRPYGIIQKQKTDYYRLPPIEEIRRRPKKIAWMVSRCAAQSKRELLHHELNKFIPVDAVDVYGKCGNLSCSRENGEDCYKMLEQNYKFYLSFENSVCEEYVTEKLYKILTRNIVPIVYGGANYTKIAPPYSVINVMDFKSIRDLANFIQDLDTHPEAYLRFFEWKKDYIVTTSPQKTLCDLCQKLNEPIQSQTYGDIAKWWQGKNFNKCKNINNLARIFS